MVITVDLCFATYGSQAPQWWSGVMKNLFSDVQGYKVQIGSIHTSTSMLADWNKNNSVAALQKRRDTMTDSARNRLTAQTLSGMADYSFWIDDDTIPPEGALPQMLQLRREFVSGLYFLPKPPFNPIAYLKCTEPEKYGLYAPVADYDKGALQQVDCVGMGCALIHRSVFEKIQAEHRVYQDPHGALVPMHKSEIIDEKGWTSDRRDAWVEHGILHTPLLEVKPEEFGDRAWPFFSLNNQRTEDFTFCELAEHVGVKPWLDTTIVCEHVKMKATTEADFRAYQESK